MTASGVRASGVRVRRSGSGRGAPRAASRAALAVLAATAALAVTAMTGRGAQAATYLATDPATWSSAQLAGQLTFTCAEATDADRQQAAAAAGIGGIALLGDPPATLGTQLAAVTAAAPAGVRPFIAGDEEGGSVQRLRDVIYPLPPAKTMGATMTPAQIRDTAQAYGQRMRALGVGMDFGPVTDLAAAGSYIDTLGRAFSADPVVVAGSVAAWSAGMTAAGVVPTIKHWPGHGQAANSHLAPAPVPPLRVLEGRDLIPFRARFAHGVPMVMVGHLISDGLTEPNTPASESPTALRYLRASAGPNTVIITDSLSMVASSSTLGITVEVAAVRALVAGADWALACSADPDAVVAAVRAAIDDGVLPRAEAVASARRIVGLKAAHGLTPPLPEWQKAITAKASELGVTVTSFDAVAGGWVGHAGGTEIYFSPATGAHAVSGAILAAYLALGDPSSVLGLPTTDEVEVPGGRAAYFTGGWIDWSPVTGAHVGYGAILDAHRALRGTGWWPGLSPPGEPDEPSVPAGGRHR